MIILSSSVSELLENNSLATAIIFNAVTIILAIIAFARSFIVKGFSNRVDTIEKHYITKDEFNQALALLESQIKEYIETDVRQPLNSSLSGIDQKYAIITNNESDRRTSAIETITNNISALDDKEKEHYEGLSQRCEAISSQLEKYQTDNSNDKESRDFAFRSAFLPLSKYFQFDDNNDQSASATVPVVNTSDGVQTEAYFSADGVNQPEDTSFDDSDTTAYYNL